MWPIAKSFARTYGPLAIDGVIGFALTAAVAFLLIVVEVCLTNGVLTDTIVNVLANTPSPPVLFFAQ